MSENTANRYFPPDIFRSKYCGDIPKLNNTNYLQWSSSMLDHFGACGNADIIQGTNKCPEGEDKVEEGKAWEIKDSQARGAIKGSCTISMRTHIEKTKTSAEMWTILEGHANSANSIKGRTALTDKFRATIPIPGEPLSNYIGKLAEIRDLLVGTTHEISDWMFQQQLLHNLPPMYNTTKEIIENKEVVPKTQEIIDILKRRELDLLRQSVMSNNSWSTTENALYNASKTYGGSSENRRNNFKDARGRGYPIRESSRGLISGGYQGSFRNINNSNRNYRTLPYQNVECFGCGKKGHKLPNCPNKKCFSCGETTHQAQNCPYSSLTQEQARNGRIAYTSWKQNRNNEGPSQYSAYYSQNSIEFRKDDPVENQENEKSY